MKNRKNSRKRADDSTPSHTQGTFAARATAPGRFSVALMDDVCPPSTVFAAYNHYAGGDKDIAVWPYNGHEGGAAFQRREQLRFVGKLLGGTGSGG